MIVLIKLSKECLIYKNKLSNQELNNYDVKIGHKSTHK